MVHLGNSVKRHKADATVLSIVTRTKTYGNNLPWRKMRMTWRGGMPSRVLWMIEVGEVVGRIPTGCHSRVPGVSEDMRTPASVFDVEPG